MVRKQNRKTKKEKLVYCCLYSDFCWGVGLDVCCEDHHCYSCKGKVISKSIRAGWDELVCPRCLGYLQQHVFSLV